MHISKIYKNKTKKSLKIAYTISQNAIYIVFSLKKCNDRNGQKHDPIQEIPKIYAKQFS